MAAGAYFDDNCSDGRVIAALRRAGLVALTSHEAGLYGSSDRDHLQFAAERKLVLVTADRDDFPRLHAEWLNTGRNHAGIIIVHQQRWGPGELARCLQRALTTIPDQDWENRIEYLGRWSDLD